MSVFVCVHHEGGDTEEYLPGDIVSADTDDDGNLVTTHTFGGPCAGETTNTGMVITWICNPNATDRCECIIIRNVHLDL